MSLSDESLDAYNSLTGACRRQQSLYQTASTNLCARGRKKEKKHQPTCARAYAHMHAETHTQTHTHTFTHTHAHTRMHRDADAHRRDVGKTGHKVMPLPPPSIHSHTHTQSTHSYILALFLYLGVSRQPLLLSISIVARPTSQAAPSLPSPCSRTYMHAHAHTEVAIFLVGDSQDDMIHNHICIVPGIEFVMEHT